MLVSIAIFENQAMPNRKFKNRSMSHRPGSLWLPSLASTSSDSCMVSRKIAFRLRMAVPNLCFDDSSTPCSVVATGGWTPFFFSLLRSRLIVFEKPNQQIPEKCRGGYFRRDNRDQLVPGFQTGRMSTSTGAEWSCARSVVTYTSVSSENKLAGSQRNTRRQTSTPEHEKKSQLTWLHSRPHWMQNHHEADPKQQCDHDSNDAKKSFDAESYDFDRAWLGPKLVSFCVFT